MSTTENDLLGSGAAAIGSLPAGHFVGGRFTGPGSRREVRNPATGDVLCEVADGSPAEVDRAVRAAVEAGRDWRRTTPGERAEALLAIADAIDENAALLAEAESLNTGKPLAVSQVEVPAASDIFRFMAGAARTAQAPAAGEYLRGHFSVIRREPVGVVGAIAPWNYPLMIAAWKAAPALAAGNTVVLKPSELTPLTTLLLAGLTSGILPPGVFNVVLGDGPDVGAPLSTASGVDLVSFTGSVRGGCAVATAAGQTTKRLHLELGGKAPVVVFADADLDTAVAGIRMAGFWNSGQDCGAATRVLCDVSIAGELTERLVAAADSLALGDPREGGQVELGPLISETQRRRVTRMVDNAISAGAVRATGGGAVDRAGYFYRPTVLSHVDSDSEVAQQEIFGPVVSVETFGSEQEAVAKANAPDYGLSASVWTNDISRALRVTDELHFGTVWTNTHLATASEMPWVGFGSSGYGRDMSTYALDDHTRTKHVMIALSDQPEPSTEGESR